MLETYLLDELSAGILKGVFKINCSRNGHSIIDYQWGPIRLLHHHVPP